VNKSELIEQIASRADISKAAATRAIDAMTDPVRTTLKKAGTATITGFGTFASAKRAARTGRNPLTGEPVKISATSVPKFRPGADFKATVAGGKKAPAKKAPAKKAAAKKK